MKNPIRWLKDRSDRMRMERIEESTKMTYSDSLWRIIETLDPTLALALTDDNEDIRMGARYIIHEREWYMVKEYYFLTGSMVVNEVEAAKGCVSFTEEKILLNLTEALLHPEETIRQQAKKIVTKEKLKNERFAMEDTRKRKNISDTRARKKKKRAER